MKVLILTGRFGMGHCCAAEAVRETLLAKAPDAQVRVVDVLEWVCPRSSGRIYGLFNWSVRYTPFLFNSLNHMTDRDVEVPLRRLMFKKLDALWREFEPELVISTLPMCARYVSLYKEATGVHAALYIYVTDIALHEEWIAANADLYFVGDDFTKQSLVRRGVDPARVVVSGIPVRARFSGEPRESACAAPERREVLIMGGGLGLLTARMPIFERLAACSGVHVTVIAGGNLRLQRRLQCRYPQIDVVGWTPDVQQYLKRADLLITKAGGITTFEAIETATPLYILRPFLAQEVGNARFIEQRGIGRVWWNRTDATEDILALLGSWQVLQTMRLRMLQLRREQSSANALLYYTYGAAI